MCVPELYVQGAVNRIWITCGGDPYLYCLHASEEHQHQRWQIGAAELDGEQMPNSYAVLAHDLCYEVTFNQLMPLS